MRECKSNAPVTHSGSWCSPRRWSGRRSLPSSAPCRPPRASSRTTTRRSPSRCSRRTPQGKRASPSERCGAHQSSSSSVCTRTPLLTAFQADLNLAEFTEAKHTQKILSVELKKPTKDALPTLMVRGSYYLCSIRLTLVCQGGAHL